MLMFCLSPITGFSLSAVAFVAGLLWHKQHQLPDAVDPEDAVRDLTMKLREPFRYRAMMLLGLPGTTRKH